MRPTLIILACLAATATALPRLLPPPPGNPQCAGLARGLTSGACSATAAALKPIADTLAGASCADLAASPAAASITPACCTDARAFIAAGCACDSAVNGIVSAAGVGAGVLAGGVRLAQMVCGTPANGGPLTSGGCKDIVACVP